MLPGAGRRAVAAEDLGAVGAAGGGGPIGVERDGPAPLMGYDLMVKRAVQPSGLDAGLAAARLVDQVVRFARRSGLIASAQLVVVHAGRWCR